MSIWHGRYAAMCAGPVLGSVCMVCAQALSASVLKKEGMCKIWHVDVRRRERLFTLPSTLSTFPLFPRLVMFEPLTTTDILLISSIEFFWFTLDYWFLPFSVCYFQRNLVPEEHQRRYRFRKKMEFLFLVSLFKRKQWDWWRPAVLERVQTAGYLV